MARTARRARLLRALLAVITISAIFYFVPFGTRKTLQSRKATAPYKFHTTNYAVGEDPEHYEKIWKSISVDSKGRFLETNELNRNDWLISNDTTPKQWQLDDKVLRSSYNKSDPCDNPLLLLPKSHCSKKAVEQPRLRGDYVPPTILDCPVELVRLAGSFFDQIGSPLTSKDVNDAIFASDDPSESRNFVRLQSQEEILYSDVPILGPENVLERERIVLPIIQLAAIQRRFNFSEFDVAMSLSTKPFSMSRDSSLADAKRRGWKRLRYLAPTRCPETNMIPILEWSQSSNGPFENWDMEMDLIVWRSRKIPFIQRPEVAIFQGALLPQVCGDDGLRMITSSTCLREGRGKLYSLSQGSPDLLNVRFTNSPPQLDCPVKLSPPLSTLEIISRHRFIVVADNQCGWMPELRKFLFSGSTVLLQTRPCREYFQHLLQPWIHYIPWQDENLLERIKWAKSHPKEAQIIAENALEFAQRYLTQHAMACWNTIVFGNAALAFKKPLRRLAPLTEPVRSDQLQDLTFEYQIKFDL